MDAFCGEIRMFTFDYAPEDWAVCDGALLSMNQNQALFSVIGNRFGGDGKTTFKLPDLSGRVAMGGAREGPVQHAGRETARVTAADLPQHSHTLTAVVVTTTAQARMSRLPAGDKLPSRMVKGTGTATVTPCFSTTAGKDSFLHESAVAAAGDQDAITIGLMQPYLALNACICLQGEYPIR